MNIVVLDGFTLNPGDLSWKELEKLGTCAVYERTSPGELASRAGGAGVLLTNKTPLDAATIRSLPDLRYIGVLATGYNIVDIRAAGERGIVVTNVPSYGTMSVAQVVFAHMFNLTHRIGHHADSVRTGKWAASKDFCYWDFPLVEVSGLTLGIVGMGKIGRAVSDVGKAFGMKILGHDPSTQIPFPPGVRRVALRELLSESDVVTLHCPLTPETKGMVNEDSISWMKKSAFLINTSRGPLLDEEALAGALNEGRIAGAGLDVLGVEPPGKDNPLLNAKNCYITPHFAWATKAARERLMKEAILNLRAFINAEERNRVNK